MVWKILTCFKLESGSILCVTIIKRHLVFSTDPRTWDLNEPLLFLNEWCAREISRDYLELRGWKICPPVYKSMAERDVDHEQMRDIENALFTKLVPILNKFHQMKQDTRFWKIILGPWFRKYIEIIFYRVRTFEKCLESGQIKSFNLLECKDFALAPQNNLSYYWSTQNEVWNTLLNSKILSMLNKGTIEHKSIHIEPSIFDEDTQSVQPKLYLKLSIQKSLRKFAERFVRDSDCMIINSYLPIFEELKLNIALKQFPQWWLPKEEIVKAKFNQTLRSQLSKDLEFAEGSTVSEIIHRLLFDLLPICNLEGFEGLLTASKNVSWPKSPKFIFTSNNFDTDEIFKIWTATKIVEGTTYIVGQHGSGYGTSRYSYPHMEVETCDRFLSWGWEDPINQVTPAFNFKVKGNRLRGPKSSKHLLLVELPSACNVTNWIGSYSFEKYFEQQTTFIDQLTLAIREDIIVRLYQPSIFTEGREIERWKSFNEAIKLDIGTPFDTLLKEAKLVVFSYDSTGILESLAKNYPTIAFWQNGLENLNDDAIPFYQLLFDVGIFHFSAESAAAKVNEVWENLDDWWGSKEVQDAKDKFCDKYSRTTNTPVRDIKRILLSK